MGQRPQRRAHRRLLPGRVAVEAEERGGGELPEQAELRLGERGAERRDRFGDPRLVERDDIHLPFDDDHAPFARGSPARPGRG